MTHRFFFLCALAVCCGISGLASAAENGSFRREQLRIVGSSTVYPFVAAAAEQFGRTSNYRTPIVEATGTGGGIKLFCAGVGKDFADIANASRAMKENERALCAKNGVHDPIELSIGFDGIVLANGKGDGGKGNRIFHLSTAQIFLALAEKVPDKSGKLVPNPYRRWNEIDASLPNEPIEVYGPPPTSGTRDAFSEIAMEKGCKEFPAFAKTYADEKQRNDQCRLLREDGRYIDAGENDNIIVQKLVTDPHALGIFGYSFLEQNADKVQASVVDGTSPTFDSISAGKYALSRSLYVYVKREHMNDVVGFQAFLKELTGEQASNEEGYMAVKGLIPEPLNVRQQNRVKINAGR